MKKTLTTLFLALSVSFTFGQNVGINTPSPQTSLDVKGGFRTQPLYLTGSGTSIIIPDNQSNINLSGTFSGPFLATINSPKDGQRLIIDNLSNKVGTLLGGPDILKGINEFIYSDGEWKLLSGKVVFYSKGDFAQGGIVFWVDETGQHGLVCAKTDQGLGIRWNAGTDTNTMAKGDFIKGGLMNTLLIIANQGFGDGDKYAARLCHEMLATNFGDWYLPSKAELNLLFLNKDLINSIAIANGGTTFKTEAPNAMYWSSYEYYNLTAWSQRFDTGEQLTNFKSGKFSVRAIRAF